MRIAMGIVGRARGVLRIPSRGPEVRRARATFPGGLENLEARQLMSKLTVSVSGTADPYLADPANSLLSDSIADGTVPPSIPVITSETLTVRATGQTSNDPANPGGSPHGGQRILAWNGSQGAISSWNLPLNSLVCVFLGDNPVTAPAPSTARLSATRLSAALGQVFYIGTGTTSDGQSMKFHAPEGATRLYLASLDGTQWSNNGGHFEVVVHASAGLQRSDRGSGSDPVSGLFC
jgi:hypothetical protein